MSQASIVFAPPHSDEPLLRRVDAVLARSGAALRYAYTEEDGAATTHVWSGTREGRTVKVVEDRDLDLSYALVDHDSAAERDTILATLTALGRATGESLHGRLHPVSVANAPLLIALVLCDSGRADAASAGLIAAALTHADPAVRRRAAMAAAMARWPELDTAVAEALARETDEPALRLLRVAGVP